MGKAPKSHTIWLKNEFNYRYLYHKSYWLELQTNLANYASPYSLSSVSWFIYPCIHSWILMPIYIYIYPMIFPLCHFRHGKGWPWNQKTQHSRHVRKRFQYLKALIPENSDGIQCLWQLFLQFFDDQKKEWWCFPRIYGSSSSKNHVFQWELPCWPPFFTSCLFVIWGLSPNFCTDLYHGKSFSIL